LGAITRAKLSAVANPSTHVFNLTANPLRGSPEFAQHDRFSDDGVPGAASTICHLERSFARVGAGIPRHPQPSEAQSKDLWHQSALGSHHAREAFRRRQYVRTEHDQDEQGGTTRYGID
jgi:hypothetical protein